MPTRASAAVQGAHLGNFLKELATQDTCAVTGMFGASRNRSLTVTALSSGIHSSARFGVVPNVDTLGQIKYILCNVSRMIGDPLQIPHN